MRNRPMRLTGIGVGIRMVFNTDIELSSRERKLVGLPPIIPAPVLVKREISRGESVLMVPWVKHPVVRKISIKQIVMRIPGPVRFFL